MLRLMLEERRLELHVNLWETVKAMSNRVCKPLHWLRVGSGRVGVAVP